MNKKLFVGTLLALGVVVPPVVSIIKFRKRALAERKQIAIDKMEELDAIQRGALRMEEKLERGEYHPKNMEQLFDDLQFEIIAAHYE